MDEIGFKFDPNSGQFLAEIESAPPNGLSIHLFGSTERRLKVWRWTSAKAGDAKREVRDGSWDNPPANAAAKFFAMVH
jgi:hypothetical protein